MPSQGRQNKSAMPNGDYEDVQKWQSLQVACPSSTTGNIKLHGIGKAAFSGVTAGHRYATWARKGDCTTGNRHRVAAQKKHDGCYRYQNSVNGIVLPHGKTGISDV